MLNVPVKIAIKSTSDYLSCVYFYPDWNTAVNSFNSLDQHFNELNGEYLLCITNKRSSGTEYHETYFTYKIMPNDLEKLAVGAMHYIFCYTPIFSHIMPNLNFFNTTTVQSRLTTHSG